MQFNNILDKIFAQPTGIKILRFMVLHKPAMTGREIAKFCKISHMQAYRVLDLFETQGIIIRRKAGKSYIYNLNEKSIIVQKFLRYLFVNEKTLISDLLIKLFNKVKPHILSMVLFGSAAEGTERPDSDIDIFVLLKDDVKIHRFNKFIEDIEIKFYEQTGNRLSPIIMLPRAFKGNIRRNKLLFDKIAGGKVIFGKELRKVIK